MLIYVRSKCLVCQEQIPSSQSPAQVDEQQQYEQTYQEPTFNPDNLEALKARARDLAMHNRQLQLAAYGNPVNPIAAAPIPQPPPSSCSSPTSAVPNQFNSATETNLSTASPTAKHCCLLVAVI